MSAWGDCPSDCTDRLVRLGEKPSADAIYSVSLDAVADCGQRWWEECIDCGTLYLVVFARGAIARGSLVSINWDREP